MKDTYKKQKLTGIEYLTNTATGEVIPFVVSSVEDRDFNFHKTWMKNLVTSLDEITNKKMSLAFWIIEHLDKENKLTYTQRQLSNETGISLDTVRITMKLLQQGEMPFLIKKHTGCYIVNPNVMFKGSHNARMGVMYDYSKCVCDNIKDKTE